MAASPSGRDRRRHARVDVDFSAIVTTDGRIFPGTLRNISRSGAAIQLDQALTAPSGTPVSIAGAGDVLRNCGATIVEADGNQWRLAFQPSLGALDFLGVAKAITS